MEDKMENVILFPKWRTVLEEESLSALKEKKYDKALTKLDKLLAYKIDNHEIVIGKLICLMELNRYEEAQDFCEESLQHNDENYYHYLHIYLTILFQTSQYELLMEKVETEFEATMIPDSVREQFQQLYNMSENMNNELRNEKSTEYISEFLKAVKKEEHVTQWQLVEKMRRVKAVPDNSIRNLLTDDTVHPVTKTAIFKWFQDLAVADEVCINKFDEQMKLKPVDITELDSHATMKQTLLLISELEQMNPSLFQLVEKLLYRYLYVRYPIMPDKEDVKKIAEALTNVSEEYLDIHKNNDAKPDDWVQLYMKEIKMCEALFLSIIEA